MTRHAKFSVDSVLVNAVGNCITVMVLSVLKYDEIYSDCLINTVHSKGGGVTALSVRLR